jgi:hypothetical protein
LVSVVEALILEGEQRDKLVLVFEALMLLSGRYGLVFANQIRSS